MKTKQTGWMILSFVWEILAQGIALPVLHE